MKHIIIGTSGHIDHGKTALIKAITGFEGDTTKEEKKRGITIDLSFSNIQNEHTNIAFIDVPGHEKLIKNMIAGSFGFDASLLVIDASEGIMPQTIEHIQILNLLKIKNIVIALSKADLVSQEQINLQKQNITKYFLSLENLSLVDIVPVSIYDNQSISKLKDTLFNLNKIEKKSNGLFRYYVDRSFSIEGSGKIVTGTILDGNIKIGDKIFDTSTQKNLNIRNLQVHEQNVQEAFISQRVAINIQNAKSPIKKGTLLSQKGYLRGFDTIDVYLKCIENRKLKHNSKVIFYIGTKQLEAKVLLYDIDTNFTDGFVKLQFDEKIFCIFDEPCILSVSGRVIAGGRVLNAINDPIKKRTKIILLNYLLEKNFKDAFLLLIAIHKKGFGLISSNQRFGLNHQEAIDILKDEEKIFIDTQELVLYPLSTKDELQNIVLDIYKKNQYALLSAKSISLKIKWASINIIQDILDDMINQNIIVLDNGVYKNKNITINNIKTHIQTTIYELISKSGITPDAPYNIYDSLDIDRNLGDNALKILTSSKKIIRLSHNLFVSYEVLSNLVRELKDIIKKEGYIDIKVFKSYYNLSRKYMISYLEYLDKQNGIISDGIKRKLEL